MPIYKYWVRIENNLANRKTFGHFRGWAFIYFLIMCDCLPKLQQYTDVNPEFLQRGAHGADRVCIIYRYSLTLPEPNPNLTLNLNPKP